ncbi:hypothetical protein L218DRAFT_875315 [Marasmius fiardii PR-910]|nr:hypothetical protein L218DRAFT_875315 [Marasmius fiardii PR-910]
MLVSSITGTILLISQLFDRTTWPLHKDDTLFRSGRPTGLNIYFSLTLKL